MVHCRPAPAVNPVSSAARCMHPLLFWVTTSWSGHIDGIAQLAGRENSSHTMLPVGVEEREGKARSRTSVGVREKKSGHAPSGLPTSMAVTIGLPPASITPPVGGAGPRLDYLLSCPLKVGLLDSTGISLPSRTPPVGGMQSTERRKNAMPCLHRLCPESRGGDGQASERKACKYKEGSNVGALLFSPSLLHFLSAGLTSPHAIAPLYHTSGRSCFCARPVS